MRQVRVRPGTARCNHVLLPPPRAASTPLLGLSDEQNFAVGLYLGEQRSPTSEAGTESGAHFFQYHFPWLASPLACRRDKGAAPTGIYSHPAQQGEVSQHSWGLRFSGDA